MFRHFDYLLRYAGFRVLCEHCMCEDLVFCALKSIKFHSSLLFKEVYFWKVQEEVRLLTKLLRNSKIIGLDIPSYTSKSPELKIIMETCIQFTDNKQT